VLSNRADGEAGGRKGRIKRKGGNKKTEMSSTESPRKSCKGIGAKDGHEIRVKVMN